MTLLRVCILFVSFCTPCFAETIEGYVINRTIDKPLPDCRVVLLSTSGEQSHTVTNRIGMFELELPGKLSSDLPEVVSAVFQDVQYFQTVVPGQRVNLSVYDASNQVAGVSGYLSILQFQVKGKQLQVTELHAFNNASNPPITRVNPENVLLTIPEGAQLQPAVVAGPERGTLTLPLIRIEGNQTIYRVDFPLKPGLTKYAITYEVPYNDNFVFRREAQYAMKRIGVVIPDSMHFRSLGPRSFHSVHDQQGTQEQVVDDVQPKEFFSFELSGEGELAQSFSSSALRPPAQTDVQAQVQALINARWPGAPAPEKTTIPIQPRVGHATANLVLAASIVGLVGLLAWGLTRRRALTP